MAERKNVVVAVFSLILLGAAGTGAWYLLGRKANAVCPLSGRPINPQTRALVKIGGQQYETCCLRCALTEARQTGKPVEILQVTDFETGRLLAPGRAWFVEDSPVNPCMRMSPAAESPGREEVYVRRFDRCSPSVLAFSSEQHARAFLAAHGGVLKRLDEVKPQ